MPDPYASFSSPLASGDPYAAFASPVDKRAQLMVENPAEYDIASPEYQAQYGAAAVPAVENFAAGAGKFFVDIGRGAKQYGAGIADVIAPRTGQSRVEEMRGQVAAQRVTDAPLMATIAGKLGYLGTGIGVTAPAMAIPGVNTVAGAGLFGAGFGAMQPSASGKETLINTALGGALSAGGQAIGTAVGNYASRKIAERVTARASEKAANLVRDTTLAEARKAGYVVPPSTANPTIVNRAAESISGKAATQQAATFRNQRITNRLIRQDLGLSRDSPLTIKRLEAVRSRAGQVYKAIKSVGEIVTDTQYLNDLADLSSSADEITRDFPDLNIAASAEIKSLQDGLLRDKFGANAAMEAIKQLRKQASGNLAWNVEDPAKKALGMAQREAAGIVEDQVIRHLKNTGKGALAAQFDKARVLIAKTYSVQGALNQGTGNIVATKLATQLRKGKPLSGGIELAAKFASAFPKAAGEQLSSPGVSAVDALIGGVGGITVNPSLAALPLGRMAARSMVLSGLYQKALAAPSYGANVNALKLLSGAAPLAPSAGVVLPAYLRQQQAF